jgi:predicted PurR-regulated permease PerM
MTVQSDEHKGVSETLVARALFLLFLVALAILAVKLIGVLMLIFGAIIVAVVLRAIADPLTQRTPLPSAAAVLIAFVLVVAIVGAVFGLFGWQIAGQIDGLTKKLPAAWHNVQARLDQSPAGQFITSQFDQVASEAQSLASRIPHFAGAFVSSLANLLVVVVGGIFLASHPDKYRDGLVLLFPKTQRDKARNTLNACGHGLKMWLMAQVVSMVLVGTLTGAGLFFVGVDSALALGLVAGVAQFIPIAGPVISAVPGLVMAASQGWQAFFWALAVYVSVSQLESNLITPTVQKHVTSVPPVVTLFAVLAFGALLGPLGVLFATPLTVVAYILIMKLYIGDTLHDSNAARKALSQHMHHGGKPAQANAG